MMKPKFIEGSIVLSVVFVLGAALIKFAYNERMKAIRRYEDMHDITC
jgi:hypothetical protein